MSIRRAPSPDKVRLEPLPEARITWVDRALWLVILASLWIMASPYVLDEPVLLRISNLVAGGLVVGLVAAVAFQREDTTGGGQ